MTTFDPANPLLQPRGAQLAMIGDDWLSDRDKRTQAKAEARRKKVGLDCAKKLRAAADSLNDYLMACNECRDGSGNEVHGAADSRKRLMGDLLEYASCVEFKHDR